MRTLALILAVIVANGNISAQQTIPPATDSTTNKINGYYVKGIIANTQGLYAKAERNFRKVYAAYPDSNTATYLYEAMRLQGADLEADVFKTKNQSYTKAIPPYKKGLESIYANAGPRISTDQSKAGNMYYGDIGVICRLSPGMRLWQTVNYLEQNNNLGWFKQCEYYAALRVYAGKGWSFALSLNYVHVNYTVSYNQVNAVTYKANYTIDSGVLSYNTNANQAIHYDVPGTADFVNVSLPVIKRCGAFTFEAKPSLHYILNKYHATYQYTSTGTTDSSLNNTLLGSQPFSETGNGSTKDTATTSYIGQLGAGVTYRWPVRRVSLSTSFSAYYLFDGYNHTAMAYYFYSLLQLRNNIWLHFSSAYKGSLPWALNAEGQYFYFYNKINTRDCISLQFNPLKRLSPVITYQYEKDTRIFDNAILNYHSFYLTLKYTL